MPKCKGIDTQREREDLEEEMAGFMTGIIVEAQTIGEQKERRFGRE